MSESEHGWTSVGSIATSSRASRGAVQASTGCPPYANRLFGATFCFVAAGGRIGSNFFARPSWIRGIHSPTPTPRTHECRRLSQRQFAHGMRKLRRERLLRRPGRILFSRTDARRHESAAALQSQHPGLSRGYVTIPYYWFVGTVTITLDSYAPGQQRHPTNNSPSTFTVTQSGTLGDTYTLTFPATSTWACRTNWPPVAHITSTSSTQAA
jgi:hypothetical protein